MNLATVDQIANVMRSRGVAVGGALTGRMKEECLEELKALLDNANPGAIVNLGDVSLVGVEVVRFLANCENAGIELVDCSPYIRDWINRELNKTKKPAS